MSKWSAPRWLRGLAAGVMAGSALVGCGQKAQPDASTESGNKASATESGQSTSTSTQGTSSSSKIDISAVAAATPVVRDALHMAFADAVRSSENPPENVDRPPDQTVSKKPVHRILEEVKSSWDSIRFTSPTGKKISYTATVDTTAGLLQIALFPEFAPNHVRNFIALAKAGYYDQLFFDCARHEQSPMSDQEVHMLEAGCPLGTGQSGTGSIGYWLKQEFTPAEKVSHDEGTVGACRSVDPDTASTKFYINLTRAPFLDGNYTVFGKVIQGVDVLRKMGKEPTIIDDEGVSRPEKAIVINKVTITAVEVEGDKK